MLIVEINLNNIRAYHIFVLSKLNDMVKLKKEIEELINTIQVHLRTFAVNMDMIQCLIKQKKHIMPYMMNG